MHPYYPLSLDIPDYVPNSWNSLQLVSTFAGACALVFLFTTFAAYRARPTISTSELITALWFVLCGSIHSVLEGYYAYNFKHMPGLQTILGQLWKEYSMSDSRYQTQDAFVLCMESITAIFWGPLSFVVAYMIITNHPLRHPFQSIVSLGQLYGDVLYYATCFFDHYIGGISYTRPEAYYYWGYFIFLNAFWIIIPLALLYNSVIATGKAFQQAGQAETRGRNGTAKKEL